jgi:hypothetical protein
MNDVNNKAKAKPFAVEPEAAVEVTAEVVEVEVEVEATPEAVTVEPVVEPEPVAPAPKPATPAQKYSGITISRA